MILLPQDMYKNGTPESLQMILSHELAHIERRDCWANLFQRIIESLFFFHPFVWLASRQLTQERERICDNHVLAEGISADDYTTLLSQIGEQAVHVRYLQTVALFEGQLLSRIRSLLDPLTNRQTKLSWQISIVSAVMVLATLLAFGSVRLAAKPSEAAISENIAVLSTAEIEAEGSDKDQKEPTKSLHQAAADGDVEQVKSLIEEGADINAKGERDNTPLCRAVKSGNMEVIQLLVKTGADVNAGNWPPLCVAVDEDNIPIAKYLIDNGANIDIPEGWTALQEAPYADTRSLEMIKLLIAKGGDVNAGPYTALHGAVDKNRQDMIELLLQNGADINAKAAKRGMTPLCLAARFYNLDMIKFLIAKGADPSIADEGGFLPLHWAASRGEKDMLDLLLSKGDYASSICAAACKGDLNRVKSLIEAGTGVNDKDEGGWTALHWAGLAESPEMADFLLARGADVNARAGHGFTPLRIAHSLPVIELLISKGADINSQDTDLGLTKLHEVCGRGRRDVAELLIARGADVNSKPAKGGMYGRTPLHFTAVHGHPDIAKLLISKGADIHAVCPWRSDHRQTALHLAARTGHVEVVEYLLAEGFDVNVQDSKGQTALDLAEREGHTEIVELLRNQVVTNDTAAALKESQPAKPTNQTNQPSRR
jgi:ankyrin repeat protein